MAKRVLDALKQGKIDTVLSAIDNTAQSMNSKASDLLLKITQESLSQNNVVVAEAAIKHLLHTTLTKTRGTDCTKLLYNLVRACVAGSDFGRGEKLAASLVERLDGDNTLLLGSLQLWITCIAGIGDVEHLVEVVEEGLMPRARSSDYPTESACKLYDIARHHLWKVKSNTKEEMACRELAIMANMERLTLMRESHWRILDDVLRVGKHVPKEALSFYTNILPKLREYLVPDEADWIHLDAFAAILEHGFAVARKTQRLKYFSALCDNWSNIKPSDDKSIALMVIVVSHRVATSIMMAGNDLKLTTQLKKLADSTGIHSARICVKGLDLLRRVVGQVVTSVQFSSEVIGEFIACCKIYGDCCKTLKNDPKKPSVASVVDFLCLSARLRLDSKSSKKPEIKQGYKCLDNAAKYSLAYLDAAMSKLSTVDETHTAPLRNTAAVYYNAGAALYNSGDYAEALQPLLSGAELWERWCESMNSSADSMLKKWIQVSTCASKCDGDAVVPIKRAIHWAAMFSDEDSILNAIHHILDACPISDEIIEGVTAEGEDFVYLFATVLADHGDYEHAQQLCCIGKIRFLMLSAKMYIARQDYAAAIQLLDRVAGMDCDVETTAQTLLWLGLAQSSLDKLREACKLSSDDSLLAMASDAMYVLGYPVECVEVMKRRCSIVEDTLLKCRVHTAVACVLSDLHCLDDAEDEWNKSFDLLYTYCDTQTKQWLQTWKEGTVNNELDINVPRLEFSEVCVARSLYYIHRYQYADAMDCLDHGVGSANHSRVLAMCLADMGHVDEALHEALKGIRLLNASSRSNGSNVPQVMATKDNDEPIAHEEWGISIQYLHHLHQVGSLYLRCGLHYTSEFYYKQGLKLSQLCGSDPFTALFLSCLTDLERRRGRLEIANGYVDQITDTYTPFPAITTSIKVAIAHLRLQEQKYNEVETLLKDVSTSESAYITALMYRVRGDVKHADMQWDSIIQSGVANRDTRTAALLGRAETVMNGVDVGRCWGESKGGKVGVTKLKAARKYLLQGYKLCSTGGVSPHIHRSVCQWLAWITGSEDSELAAEYITESIDVSARHQMMASLVLRLDRVHVDHQRGVLDDESYNKRMAQYGVMENIFSFSDNYSFDDRKDSLCSEWVTLSLSLSPCGKYVMMARVERGIPSIVSRVNTVSTVNEITEFLVSHDAAQSRLPVHTLLNEMNTLHDESRDSAKRGCANTSAAKRQWWVQRSGMEKDLERLLLRTYEVILGGNRIGEFIGEADTVLLMLDGVLQSFPLENTGVLSDYTCTRVPSLPFAQWYSNLDLDNSVNINSTYYVLNPSKDLVSTQQTLLPVFEKMGWEGIAGQAPTADQCLAGVEEHDLFMYCGHSAGEQYLRASALQQAQGHAVALLMGCSSGALKQMGEFDPQGMALSYIIAGCPAIVANLWDVTDKDIDRFTEALLGEWKNDLCPAVERARNSCKLRHLTGAAPIIYGHPVDCLGNTLW